MTILFLWATLALGAFFRFRGNTAIALWHDEAFSALYLRYPFAEMMHRIALDVHPPLYYLVLRAWSYAAGQSLPSLRVLSIIFGVLTIWAAYIFVRAAFRSTRLALLAALFVAINPFQIQYALEARMYTLGTFLALWSSYFLIRAITRQEERGGFNKYWLAYAITAAAAFYTHYYLIFTIAAQGLYLLVYAAKSRSIKILLAGAGAYAIVAAFYLPWLPTLLKQITRVQGGYWIPPADIWSVPGTVWKMVFGGQGAPHLWLLATSAVSLFVVIFFLRKNHSFSKWLVAAGLLVPLAAAIALSLRTNIYLDRYFVFASVFFSILIALAFWQVSRRLLRFGLVLAIAAASIFAIYKNTNDLDIKNSPGMAAASAYINQNAKTGDDIYVASSFIFFTFKYYNAAPIKPLLYSTSKIENIPHFSGTAILTNDDLVMDFGQTKSGNTVWLLWTTGFGSSKPPVPAKYTQIEESAYKDTPGFKGSIFVTKYFVR